ncbi:MAG: hypothetical protein ACYDH9_24440 [Limisphaerales bacterium]
MNFTAAIIIAAGVWWIATAWRRHRQRVAEAEAMDRAFRASLIRRERAKARNEEEEGYLLKLRAGVKAEDTPGGSSLPAPAKSHNKHLD